MSQTYHFQDYFQNKVTLVEEYLRKYLPETAFPPVLIEAMRYSLLAGGKRIRPVMTLAAAELCGGQIKQALPVACAIELIHTYSLIHDDLPAMDNDDLRRGRPTSHKVYGDAMAILAGDTLQAYAYQLIAVESRNEKVLSSRIVRLIDEVGGASGALGMAGGQVLDLQAEGKHAGLAELEKLHSLKTGALFTACIRAGAIVAGSKGKELKALTKYSRHLGLLFQIVDDILDVTQETAVLGKPKGSDERKNKSTYVQLLGLDGAREKAVAEAIQSKACLDVFGEKAYFFKDLIDYLLTREK